MAAQIFRTKGLDALVSETEVPRQQLKRTLGPFDVVMLGIGAIVGAGIFATIGTAAAGDAARPGAGPALILSFVVTAIACGFAALCYAEFASMVPISGSAYTYAYATLGELVAWIIGWDLILEYALAASAVAVGWSGYLRDILGGFVKLTLQRGVDRRLGFIVVTFAHNVSTSLIPTCQPPQVTFSSWRLFF